MIAGRDDLGIFSFSIPNRFFCSSVYNSTFPKYDINLFIKSEINYPVAINGKRKLIMMIANNLNKNEIEKIIYSNDKINQILTRSTV